ncbi:virulence plasmid B protein, partial [Polaromonas sp. CF318]|uniref:FG-GAP-like repeat-containing protein n=1 Tax=Polaromonas sp. CF318 TaxID=1144318 RepID=UPI000270F2C8
MQGKHSKVLCCAALWLLGAGLGLAQAQTTTVAGTTPGQFSVNESGAATYRIPIQVPPGIAGMEPKLELSYNSQGGNGLMGMGWSLSGLSAIGRCPRTMAVDGFRGGVNFDMNDRYCLDGQRLILVSGTYGAAGSEYRTELDSFSKIVASGAAGNGVASFTVQTKAGLTMEYGNTADSRIEAQGKATVRVWAVNKISDVKSNIMTFGYYKSADSSVYAPLNIGYGGNTAAGLANSLSVSIQYDTTRTDKTKVYQGGSLIQQDRRISGIQLYNGSTLTKTYSLAYSPSPATSRSRLVTVAECAPGGSCLPQSVFAYKAVSNISLQPLARWHTRFGDADAFNLPQYYSTLQLVDVNNDGLADLCSRNYDGIYCGLNLGTGSGFGALTRWSTSFTDAGGLDQPQYYSTIRYPDVNGDGLPDICVRLFDGIYCGLNNGTTFSSLTRWSTRYGDDNGWSPVQYYSTIQYLDLNGDGLADICGRGGDGLYCALNLGNGSGFGPVTRWSTQYGDNNGWGVEQYYSTIQYMDLNGDGLPDVCGRGGDGLFCALNLGTGAGFGTATLWLPILSDANGFTVPQYYSTIQFPDLNGDGLADVCARTGDGISCAINTGNGTGFSNFGSWSNSMSDAGGFNISQYYATIRYVDINGDGLPDVCARMYDGFYCGLNTGNNGFGGLTQWSASYGNNNGWGSPEYYSTMRYADINGDGGVDVCGRAIDGYYCTTSLPNTNDRLETVTKNGQVTTVALSSLVGNPAVYTKDVSPNAAAYPKLDLQYAQYVVSTVASSNGIGGTVTTQYNYGGLKAEMGTGRGLLGFRWMKSKNLSNNIESYTEFNQNWPFTGSVAKSETRLAGSGNAGVLKRTTNSYAQGTG